MREHLSDEEVGGLLACMGCGGPLMVEGRNPKFVVITKESFEVDPGALKRRLDNEERLGCRRAAATLHPEPRLARATQQPFSYGFCAACGADPAKVGLFADYTLAEGGAA